MRRCRSSASTTCPGSPISSCAIAGSSDAMRQPRLLDDCFVTDKARMRHDEALALLRARLAPVVGVEPVSLSAAAGRILDETVTAPHPVPLSDNAAVDGYAFAHEDYTASGGRLRIAARIAAGHPSDTAL